MKCFYHNDADGLCAAFWVNSNVKINDSSYYDDKPEMYALDYRSNFPMSIIRSNEQIYMVDYSISTEEMVELLKITRNVTWIDHHKSSIEKYANFPQNIRGVRYDGIAACMLTYCYLNHMTSGGEGDIKSFAVSMTEYAPMFTKLIADADVLKFNYGDDTRYFFVAFNFANLEPDSPEWSNFTNYDNYEEKLIEKGKIIEEYKKVWAKDYLKLGFETVIDGYKCFAINLGYSGIQFFDSLNERNYDIFICFVFDGNQYIVSMYSNTVDVSLIAQKFGGGGHKMAAGFQCKKLPFKRVTDNVGLL